MIDLTWTELTVGLALLFFVSFAIYIASYYRRYLTLSLNSKSRLNTGLAFFSLILIIFVSSGSNSDWYHYQDMVWNYKLYAGAHNHGEPIYGYIIQFINKNYLLFRLIVWGGAFLIVIRTFKRFNLNINMAVFFLVAVFLLKFNYARASLGMSCYFFGLSFLLRPKKTKKILNIVVVALFFWGAYEFHHSLLPVILLTIAAYFPLDKPIFTILLIITVPLLASYVFSHLNLLSHFINEENLRKFEGYVQKETGPANFFGQISNIIQYGAFILPLGIDILSVFKNQKKVEIPIRRLLRITIAIVLFSLMFLFMSLPSTVFTYRYLFMTLIPITIISVYLYQNFMIKRRLFSLILLWGIVSNAYALFYGLYTAL